MWTNESVEKFKGLYDQGLSFGLIAQQMRGYSRNALIGKASRLGWQKRAPVSEKKRVRESRAKAACWLNRSLVRQPKPQLSPEPVEPTPAPEPQVITTKHIVQFMQLENCNCRFPLWHGDTPFNEQWFCGTPTADAAAGRPYCEGHDAIAYPPRARPAWSEAAE